MRPTSGGLPARAIGGEARFLAPRAHMTRLQSSMTAGRHERTPRDGRQERMSGLEPFVAGIGGEVFGDEVREAPTTPAGSCRGIRCVTPGSVTTRACGAIAASAGMVLGANGAS